MGEAAVEQIADELTVRRLLDAEARLDRVEAELSRGAVELAQLQQRPFDLLPRRIALRLVPHSELPNLER